MADPIGFLWPGPPLSAEQIDAHPLVRVLEAEERAHAPFTAVSSLARGVDQVPDQAHPTVKPPPPRAA